MRNLANDFENIFLPKKALIVYQSAAEKGYVESYDVNETGHLINAHPLNLQESAYLAKVLDTAQEHNRSFLRSKGLLPNNILHINPTHAGFVVWHTPPQKRQVLFSDNLSIPNGEALMPDLIWKADKTSLQIFAVRGKDKLTLKTPLCQAPFFNIHNDGTVCMGTVDIEIDDRSYLETFIQRWEQYFFGSYFSHLLQDTSPVKDNIVCLWQELVNANQPFPQDQLLDSNYSLQQLFA